MEAKQHAPEQLRREVKTCFKTNEMETHRTHQNLWDADFIGYEYCYSCFLLVSICMGYLFPALHFQSVCVPCFEVGLL